MGRAVLPNILSGRSRLCRWAGKLGTVPCLSANVGRYQAVVQPRWRIESMVSHLGHLVPVLQVRTLPLLRLFGALKRFHKQAAADPLSYSKPAFQTAAER